MPAALLLALVLTAPESDPRWPFADRREQFGAVLAPALVPNGALALYGNAGFPEIDAGFRQGFAGFEIGGRFAFDYYRVTVAAEVDARAFALRVGSILEVVPTLALGVGQNFGSTYFDPLNQFYFAARVRPGAVAAARLSRNLYAIAQVDLAFERALSLVSSFRFVPTLAAGGELYLTEDVSISVLGRAGVDWLSYAPNSTVRPTFGVRFGLGFRLF